MEQYDILIIGAGAAGISAAKTAAGKVLLVERGDALGGVLLQCAHRGFGQGQTGMEYAAELRAQIPDTVEVCLNTTVVSVSPDRTALLCDSSGRREIGFSQLILATGCREIPMGALPIAGTRPKGVYTAGQMQKRMNLHGQIPEGPVVILGSGDLGLIMAEHLARLQIPVTLVEKKPVCGGLTRNQRCLTQYPIALICNTTVTSVHGQQWLEGCTLENGQYLPCKTLLIAVGLRPERELVLGMEGASWVHLCGNCKTVHPMVEAVVNEGKQAGRTACQQVR